MGPISISVTLLDHGGMLDELGEAHLGEHELTLEGYLAPSVSISWEELARLLEHPFVQERLDAAWEVSDL